MMSNFSDGVKQSMSTTMGKVAGCCGCLVLVIVAIGILSALGQTGKNTGTSKPAQSDNSSSSTSANTSTPTTAKQPITLLDLTGTGTKTTEKFTAGGDWDLNWSYDCSSFEGGKGNFQVMIYNSDGTLSTDNNLVNQLGTKDTGVEHYHTGGTFYLSVNSECTWTLNAKG